MSFLNHLCRRMRIWVLQLTVLGFALRRRLMFFSCSTRASVCKTFWSKCIFRLHGTVTTDMRVSLFGNGSSNYMNLTLPVVYSHAVMPWGSMRWEATVFWSIASPWTPPWTPCKKEAGFDRSSQSPEHHPLTEHMLNSTSFPLKHGHFQDKFLGFPDLTGGRWYQVLDLFAQDLRRTDVVTFNCAVAACEEIRFTFGGSFLLWEQWFGSTDFFFISSDFRRCMSFSWFFGMGVIGATKKGGKLSLSGISSLLFGGITGGYGAICAV